MGSLHPSEVSKILKKEEVGRGLVPGPRYSALSSPNSFAEWKCDTMPFAFCGSTLATHTECSQKPLR